MKYGAKEKDNKPAGKKKSSAGFPLFLTLFIHGAIILFLILEPFSKITESSLNYITLNTDLMEFVETGGSDAPDFPSVQKKSQEAEQTMSVSSTSGSASDAAVNLDDTTGTIISNEFATPDTIESNGLFSDNFNYMDFYSGSGGGGKGGTGIMAGNMKLPTFMGGDFNVFRNWFLRHFNMPLEAPRNYRERVVVAFSVDKTGAMQNIKVNYCSSPEVEKEIISTLKNAPKWEPGQYNGTIAGFNLQMPVNFK
jgi:hypothetical protein